MSMVLVTREDAARGAYIGFLLDHESVECSHRECVGRTVYQIRYTEDQQRNLPELRQEALRVIESEHPRHSEEFRLA